MRWTAVLVVLALAGVAHADDDAADDDYAFVWPKRLRGIYTGGSAYRIGDGSGGGPAITADYAVGRKRWALGVEGQVQWLATAGFSVRAGGVMRWLARSFRPDSSGKIDLYFDVDPGINVIAKDADAIVRPDLRFGWGWQIGDTGHKQVRLAVRVIMAPRTDSDPMVSCKADCPSKPVFPFDDGFEVLIGASW